MTLENLLLFFVGVTVLAIVLQAVAVCRTARVTRESVQQIRGMSEGLHKDVRELLGRIQILASDVEDLRRVLETLSRRAADAGERLDARVRDLESLARELSELGRREAAKIDQVVDETVERVRQTAGLLHDDVLRPLVEIGSLLKAVRTGLGYLFNRRGADGRESTRSNDLFI
ncbi:MAG TPA: hypothetical protein PLM33_02245 [Acidobacteriota bacterium]|nr:hypothetical protein [Acidobacteriota bacterium]HRV07158.1 hypothetical protein [Acidobacteriota bacterium]